MHALHSEHWHAVRALCPRLREGVEVAHRQLRGQPWVLLIDPAAQRFHRIAPALWPVLMLMDGRHTLDQIWQQVLTRAGEQAAGGHQPLPLGQPELVELLAQLHGLDLLQTQVTPDAWEVFERYRRQKRQRLRQALFNPLGLKLPLLYPDCWFTRQKSWADRLFSRWGLLLWLLVVVPTVPLAWQHWDALTRDLSSRVLSVHNLLLLWCVYPLVKAVHEAAHGWAVKRWGGTVREMGLMLVMFTPVPYVDATSSYAFRDKWQRAAVALAGMGAELLLGAIALHVWLASEAGLVSAIAYNVVLIAGFSTLVVNGNPLMRYDGYYALCDLIELPNLSQRSMQYWTWLIDRHLYGARDAEPPLGSEHERLWLLVYGAVAPVYRLGVTIGLIWFIAGEYFLIGVVMALLSCWSGLLRPLWQGWLHLCRSPALALRRAVALRRTALILLGLASVLVGVPLPFRSVHEAVVWLPDEAFVRAGESGQIESLGLHPGDLVERGQPLWRLQQPALETDLAVAEAVVQQLSARLRVAEVEDRAQAQALRRELAASRQRHDELARRVAALLPVAGVTGRWFAAEPVEPAGRFARRGQMLGYLVSAAPDRLRVAVTQADMMLVRNRLERVEVRLARRPDQVLPARVHRQVPGGANRLVSAALGTSGGGAISVDPADQQGLNSLDKVFDLEIVLDRPVEPAVFGDRAHVRFDLGTLPLAWQWALRLRQLFLARLGI